MIDVMRSLVQMRLPRALLSRRKDSEGNEINTGNGSRVTKAQGTLTKPCAISPREKSEI